MDALLKISQAAKQLHLTVYHVYRLIAVGELPTIEVGFSGAKRRTLRVTQEAVDQFIESRIVDVTDSAYTVAQVAELLSVTKFHVYRLIAVKELAAVEIGLMSSRRRTLRITPKSLALFISSRASDS